MPEEAVDAARQLELTSRGRVAQQVEQSPFEVPRGPVLYRLDLRERIGEVVDIRRGSPTFGEWEGFRLDDGDGLQVYCPIGFAHGFCVTSETADVVYKCSSYYDPQVERSIAWNDPEIGVQWPAGLDLVASDRDAAAPTLEELRPELRFDRLG